MILLTKFIIGIKQIKSLTYIISDFCLIIRPSFSKDSTNPKLVELTLDSISEK